MCRSMCMTRPTHSFPDSPARHDAQHQPVYLPRGPPAPADEPGRGRQCVAPEAAIRAPGRSRRPLRHAERSGRQGREYILSTSDEDYPEFLNILGPVVPQEVIDRLNEIVCAWRSPAGPRDRLPDLDSQAGGLQLFCGWHDRHRARRSSQQAELYNYQSQDGIDEVINHSPSGPASEQIQVSSRVCTTPCSIQ